MPQESIIDTSKPNAGRIYDYLLGGSHNFEVDRMAAERIRAAMPLIPKSMRLQRWCLQDLATELAHKRGFKVIVDFASGLPTNDHIHYVVPKDTTVIYSDWDPVVVEYAREILKETPNTYFFQADARRPEELLERPEIQQILGGRRDVAIVYWGVSMFLADEDITRAARYLAEWSGPKACWAFNAQGAVQGPSESEDLDMNDPRAISIKKIYEQMGSALYLRKVKEYEKLVEPWQPDQMGFISFLDWHGIDRSEFKLEDRPESVPGGGGYGAYLIK